MAGSSSMISVRLVASGGGCCSLVIRGQVWAGRIESLNGERERERERMTFFSAELLTD
jgi:hypothetical protein